MASYTRISVSSSLSTYDPHFLKHLLDSRFSEAHTHHPEIIRLVLNIFGDNETNIQFLLSQMQNPLLKKQFVTRAFRHLAYVEALAQNKSVVEIIKNPQINPWYQSLSSLNAMKTLEKEVQETYGFVSDPREILFSWKNASACATAKQLYRNRIEKRKQLYLLTNRSTLFNPETQQQMSTLLYKDVALYVEGVPYRWITALQDWSLLYPQKKATVDAITDSMPPFSKDFDITLPKSYVARIKSYKDIPSWQDSTMPLIAENVPTFQEYICLLTILSIECTLNLSNPSFDLAIWIKKFAKSEQLRSALSFYSQHKEILIHNPPRKEDYTPQDYCDVMSFHLYFCMEIEICLSFRPSPYEGKKEEKHFAKDTHVPKLFETAFCTYLIKAIFHRNTALDHCIQPHFPSNFPMDKRKVAEQYMDSVKEMRSLKRRIDIPLAYEFFFLIKMSKEKTCFNKITECIPCLTSLLTPAELCEVMLLLTRFQNPTEMVNLLKVLSASPFIHLNKHQIESLILQADRFPPILIQNLFAQLIYILTPEKFTHLKGKAFTLLEHPTYHQNTSKGASFLVRFDFHKRKEIDEALFFKVYRLFLEGHLHAKHLDYLHKYQDVSETPFTTNTQLAILSQELPKVLHEDACKVEILAYYIAYLHSLPFLKLNDVEKASLAFHWSSCPSSKQLQAHLNTVKELILELSKYIHYVPRKKDLYLLLKLVPNCAKNIAAMRRLFLLREQIMQTGKGHTLNLTFVNDWENALDHCDAIENPLFLPSTEEETSLSKLTMYLKNYCRLATFLEPQLFTDCFYIRKINRSQIIFTDSFYNHGGRMKKLLPHTFLTVNWELPITKQPLTLSVFFFHSQSKIGQWLFFPLPISLRAHPQAQTQFFERLRKLAKIVLAENETQNKPADKHLFALQKMHGLDNTLDFLTDLKIKVRNAWWDLLSLRPPEQPNLSTSFSPEAWAAQGKISINEGVPGKERKDHKQRTSILQPLVKKTPLLTLLPGKMGGEIEISPHFTASEISETVVAQAQKVILNFGKDVFLSMAKLSGLGKAEARLFISSSLIHEAYKVVLYLMLHERADPREPAHQLASSASDVVRHVHFARSTTFSSGSDEREKLSLSPIHYPLPFIQDKETLRVLLSSHLLGLKTYYYHRKTTPKTEK